MSNPVAHLGRCEDCRWSVANIVTRQVPGHATSDFSCNLKPPTAIPIPVQGGLGIMSVRPGVNRGDFCRDFEASLSWVAP